MNAKDSILVPCRDRGWRMGLTNMLAKENFAWWRTRQWWVQCLIAMILLNGSMALNLRDLGSTSNAVYGFCLIAGTVVPIAAIIMGQESILVERHSGTTAWVFSKPLRRPAFILAKLIAYGLGFLVTWVVVPGAVAFLQLIVRGWSQWLVSGYIAMIGLIYLNLFFYLTLALMLAVLLRGRGAVLGIALILVWGWLITPLGVRLADVMPWRLLLDLGRLGIIPNLAGYLVRGQPLPTVAPILATALLSVLFVGVAIWRILREEF